MRSTSLALAAAIVVALAAPALAETIVVKKSGAVKTITDAVGMAADGDKIVMLPDHEDLTVGGKF